MIFIPTKDIDLIEREYDSDILHWYYNKNYIITFQWRRTPKYNQETQEITYIKDKDPFYLRLKEINGEEILKCSLNACQCSPQLRYNKIINKWYCNCPSSAICTKDNDQDELDEMLFLIKEYTKEKGFYDNPIEAIINWNFSQIKTLEQINKTLLNEFLNNPD